MPNEFEDKTILVTGGTGSIGSVIVQELLRYNPKRVRVFSRDETKQFELMHQLNNDPRVAWLIGDIRDKERLSLAMENIDIVFHAAALKHVFSCEINPFEAVKTNVLGTQNVIDCAFANGVDKVVGISTDKATDPSSVMGCTKLLAEKIMLASHHYKGFKKTRFCFVRFGNVLFARGSVIPLFIKQIKKGGPVTVTDERMERFVMSIKEAVNLIFKAAALMNDREIFILKMPSLNLIDLVSALINIYAPKYGYSSADIKIQKIGKKHGERIVEKLLTIEEAEYALDTDDMFIITPIIGRDSALPIDFYPGAKKASVAEFTTVGQNKLTISEIEQILLKEADF